MEDLQKQHTEESVPRRRRAVRAVPMSAAQEHTGGNAVPQNRDAHPIPKSKEEAAVPAAVQDTTDHETPAPAAVQKPKHRSEEIDAAFAEELNRAFFTEQIQMTEEIPAADHPEAAAEDKRTDPVSDTVHPEPVEPHVDSTDAAAVQHPLSPVWITVGAVLVLILLSAVFVLPFLGRTKAVMLYVDDIAVGYLEHEEDASAQMERVREDLRLDAIPDTGAVQYRCESTEVYGNISYLSSDAVYDALIAQATDGYVRAYRLFAQDGSINYAFGVMTEAEILSAIDAATAICLEQYASALPAGAQISVEPCFAWEAAWIAEDAIVDEGTLVSRIMSAQETDSAMLSAMASLTETEAERIPYETMLVPNDENFDGIRTMISPGADGLAQVTYRIWYDPETGAELSREETARTVVREPVSAVSYEGLYPLPDGVSTGTFDWPLPPLPDDEMPTDENGNPYMPENPLALKNTYVSSGYGERDLWGEYDFHLGLDIVAPAYTEIYAADGGVVVFAAFTSSYGYMTRIRHAGNVETVYAHQIKLAVKPGDIVQKGQLIGYVGSTGNSSGSHLHLEFRRDHVTVDPLEYIAIPEGVLVLGEGY